MKKRRFGLAVERERGRPRVRWMDNANDYNMNGKHMTEDGVIDDRIRRP